MESSTSTIRGVIHGNIIALLDDPGLPQGQVVSVAVSAVPMTKEEEAHAGLVRAFGSWADDPKGLDKYLDWNQEQRNVGRRDIDP